MRRSNTPPPVRSGSLEWSAKATTPRPVSPSRTSGPPMDPAEKPSVNVLELNAVEKFTFGGPEATVRIEHCNVASQSVIDHVSLSNMGNISMESNAIDAPLPAPTDILLQDTRAAAANGSNFTSRYHTPFGLREPVTVTIDNSHFTVSRHRFTAEKPPIETSLEKVDPAAGSLIQQSPAAQQLLICQLPLRAISKIKRTSDGISVAASMCYNSRGESVSLPTELGLSVQHEWRASMIMKVLHARTRGAPLPDEKPTTRAARPDLPGVPLSAAVNIHGVVSITGRNLVPKSLGTFHSLLKKSGFGSSPNARTPSASRMSPVMSPNTRKESQRMPSTSNVQLRDVPTTTTTVVTCSVSASRSSAPPPPRPPSPLRSKSPMITHSNVRTGTPTSMKTGSSPPAAELRRSAAPLLRTPRNAPDFDREKRREHLVQQLEALRRTGVHFTDKK